MTPILDAALAAYDAGLSIIPIESGGTKKPPFTWGRYQKERASREEVIRWFAPGTYTGLATICGRVSGNLGILDFDDAATYQLFRDTAEAIDLTVVAEMAAGYAETTPSGGAHLPFFCEAIGRNTALAERPGPDPQRPKLGRTPLIETREEGGYGIIAPSNGQVHPSGGAWTCTSGSPATILTITPQQLAEIGALARSFDEMPPEEPSGAHVRDDKSAAADEVKPGADFRTKHGTVATFTPLIKKHGWQLTHQRGDVGYYRRPDKTKGISATFGHGGSDLFYVFSTSTEFDSERGYNAFSVYAILEHGGDFSAAAKALAKAGYGTPLKQPTITINGRPAPGSKGKNRANEQQTSADATTEEEEASYNLTDLGNAERLVAAHGHDIRYCKLWSKWLVYDGKHWIIDNTMQVERYAKQVARDIYLEALQTDDLEERQKRAKHALSSEQDRRITGMINLAKSSIAIAPDALDQNIWLLNCQNGTINLRTGQLRPHDRADYITKLAPVEYDPKAKAERWEHFMLQVADGDEEQVSFIRRAFGYSLCGDQSERVLLICWGGGRNGKTVMMETVAATLGRDYSSTLPAESLMLRRGDDDRMMQQRAALRGARFAVASESAEGARINEALIKSLTGNERLSGRYLYGEPFDFEPTHTLWLATNHKPAIRDTTNSTWDRLRLIPFSVRFVTEEEDPDAPEELRAKPNIREYLGAESAGILTWLVAGCSEWQRKGLGTAKRIQEATKEYRQDEDLLGRFIDECCLVLKRASVPATQIYNEYTKWCEQSGERAVTQTAFGRGLSERGYERKRRETGIEWQGIGLRLRAQDTESMYGSEWSEPHSTKPPHKSNTTDFYRKTVQDHTDPTENAEEQVF